MPIADNTPPDLTGTNRRLNRQDVLAKYAENRARTLSLFSIISEDDYFVRPIELRNPLVFYEGHIPAFGINTYVKRALGGNGVDDELELLFARGIDPDAPPDPSGSQWPDRRRVRQYVDAADALLEASLTEQPLAVDGHQHLHLGEAVKVVLEHEQMHQETLLYMLHRLEPGSKAPLLQRPPRPRLSFESPTVKVAPGAATVGAERDRFGWDNEHESEQREVDGFEIDRYPVTNAQFLTFVECGGYSDRRWWGERAWNSLVERGATHPMFWERAGDAWLWRGMFERLPLPADWPVYATLDEAWAYARWQGGRVMSEEEFHRAAYGTPEGDQREQPWGDAAPSGQHGNFGFERFDPEPVGSHPDGASAWGIHDLIGNGWEWTSSPFAPLSGFRPMNTYPEYSADFFDGKHFVLKGASPVTHGDLVRASFRNWFRPDYPFVYAKFRVAR